MDESDAIVLERVSADESADSAGAAKSDEAVLLHRKPRGWQLSVGSLAVGVALVVLGIGVLTAATAEIRIVASLVGLGLIAFGGDALLKRRFGAQFPTGLWLAVAWLVIVVFCAVFADFLPFSEARDSSKTLLEPIRASPDLFSDHPLGTDSQGLDVLGGIAYGSRVSLTVGFGAVAIGMALGGLIGVASGYYRGVIDRVTDIIINAALSFPPLVLLLAVAAVLPRNTRNITLALALLTIPAYVRLARANTLVMAQREFVVASRALGARSRRIIMRDLIPGVMTPLMSYGFVVIAVVIVAEAGLSFLGLGIPRPQPTLGNMIAAGQELFETRPHLVFAPATALFLLVLSLNRLGEEARRRWDPRESRL